MPTNVRLALEIRRLAFSDSEAPLKPKVLRVEDGNAVSVMITFDDALRSKGGFFAGGGNNSQCGQVLHDSAVVDLSALRVTPRMNASVSQIG